MHVRAFIAAALVVVGGLLTIPGSIGVWQARAVLDEDAFVEWAEVHGELYGTRHSDVEAMLMTGRVVLLDIDVQGGIQVLERYGDRVASVFVFPPSWEELARRLAGRGTESEDLVQRRLANARGEVAQARRYGHFLVNDELETARAELEAIYVAESIRARRWEHPPVGP